MWYNRFKEDREDVNDNAGPGHPSTSTADENIEAVKKMILNNHRITIREVADDVCISFGSCQATFTNVLVMKRATAQIVPKLLSFVQKKHDIDIAQDMLTTLNNDPDLLKKVTTSDESCLYSYDIDTKAQSSQCKRPE